MASGFQQDPNQLSPDFYRVVLTLSGGTGAYNGAAPADGAVNPTDWNGFTTPPSSLANAQRLARGNMRWQAIIEEVTKHADAQILDVEVTSADNTDANSVPTAIAFTVKYDRDEFVLGALSGTKFTPTGDAEVTIDTVAKALRYLVAQGIVRGGTSGYTRTYRVYEPASIEELQTSITINQPDVFADVIDDVAVTAIDGTALTD